jgi:hypothetical protein
MSPSTSAPTTVLVDLAPAYWRILVSRVPRIAADRLARDLRSGQFRREGLRARARDLRAHVRPDIRDRARIEFLPALEMAHDGLEPFVRFD